MLRPVNLKVQPSSGAAVMVRVALAIVIFGPTLTRAGEPDWPQWRGPGRDNVWPVAGFPQKLPDKFRELWKQPVGGGFGGIAVVGDSVFLMDRQTSPKEVERVVCLDFDTGKPKWVREYPASYKGVDYGNGPRSTPTVHDGKVYTLGTVGHVHCLDAASGNI